LHGCGLVNLVQRFARFNSFIELQEPSL
jgi:hypothetical protein